uniref:Beta-lactamase domain-containing protein n=1 Tax=Angiostrongylus cantonensis TaxID=6313 RepID=A0A0K0DP04_ANGCA
MGRGSIKDQSDTLRRMKFVKPELPWDGYFRGNPTSHQLFISESTTAMLIMTNVLIPGSVEYSEDLLLRSSTFSFDSLISRNTQDDVDCSLVLVWCNTFQCSFSV